MRLARSMFLLVTLMVSNAALAASCEELAGAFAKNAAAMSDTELGRLRTCVSDVLRQRFAGSGVTPPAPAAKARPPVPAPPPPPPPPPPAPGPAR